MCVLEVAVRHVSILVVVDRARWAVADRRIEGVADGVSILVVVDRARWVDAGAAMGGGQ